MVALRAVNPKVDVRIILSPPKMTEVYKIVGMSEFGNYKTLFHGVHGSKLLGRNIWIKADKKYVVDGSGGKCYLSGIHCFKNKKVAEKYLTRFSNTEDKLIIKCEARNLRQKPTNKHVWLADEIYIPYSK